MTETRLEDLTFEESMKIARKVKKWNFDYDSHDNHREDILGEPYEVTEWITTYLGKYNGLKVMVVGEGEGCRSEPNRCYLDIIYEGESIGGNIDKEEIWALYKKIEKQREDKETREYFTKLKSEEKSKEKKTKQHNQKVKMVKARLRLN